MCGLLPVNTRRRFNGLTMLLTSIQCCINVKTTSCAYWASITCWFGKNHFHWLIKKITSCTCLYCHFYFLECFLLLINKVLRLWTFYWGFNRGELKILQYSDTNTAFSSPFTYPSPNGVNYDYLIDQFQLNLFAFSSLHAFFFFFLPCRYDSKTDEKYLLISWSVVR